MSTVRLDTMFSSNMLQPGITTTTTNSQHQHIYYTEYYPDWYYSSFREFHPVCPNYYPFQEHNYYTFQEAKYKQAFAVAKMLVEKELVKPEKIKNFIELVEDIYKLL